MACFFDFLRKSTTMYYINDRFQVLQMYETYGIIINIIQYINIFLQIHFGWRVWRMRKLFNEG